MTDLGSGTVRDYGTTRYRPPADLADLVRARDGHCYEPGCRVPAHRCDLDHPRPSPRGPSPRPDAGGTTSENNLAPGCRSAHQLAQTPGWQVRHDTDPYGDVTGAYTWTTPTGHRYTREPHRPLQHDPPGQDHYHDDDPPPF